MNSFDASRRLRVEVCIALLLASCGSTADPIIEGPLEGISQKLFLTQEGSALVTFSFVNRTHSPLPRPAVKTSCACQIAEIAPDPAQPGEVVRVRIAFAASYGAGAGEAIISWQGAKPLRVEWTAVVGMTEQLAVAPASIATTRISLPREVVCAFLANYPDSDLGPPELTASVGAARLNCVQRDTKRIGIGRYSGYVALQLPASLSAPALTLSSTGLAPANIRLVQ